VSPSPDEWKKEAYKAYVAGLKADEAAQSETRRQAGQVAIWLDPSPDDAKTFTKDHQAELYQVLGPLLRDKGLEVKARFVALDSADAVGGYTGEFVIALAFIPAITQVLVAWIRRKPGRKVRVEFHPSGKVKTVEAQTEEQILSLAKALDQEARAEAPKAKTK
jgi:hypothetical protein